MPPAFSACANFACVAFKIWRGSTPTSLLSAIHPFVQVASLAGYPQCHQIRNSYGSTGQHGFCSPVKRLQLVEQCGNTERLEGHVVSCVERWRGEYIAAHQGSSR